MENTRSLDSVLAQLQRAVLKHLESDVDSHDDGFSWGTAITHLATHEEVLTDRQFKLLLEVCSALPVPDDFEAR